jgi:hypothetical protein
LRGWSKPIRTFAGSSLRRSLLGSSADGPPPVPQGRWFGTLCAQGRSDDPSKAERFLWPETGQL